MSMAEVRVTGKTDWLTLAFGVCDIWHKESRRDHFRNVRPPFDGPFAGERSLRSLRSLMQKASVLRIERPRRAATGIVGRIQFEYFAALTVILTYALIVLGGTVRATDSGTACPDWPLCHGRVFPRIEEHVLIEYSHRLMASIVGLFIVATVVWAWKRAGHDPLVRGASVLAVALLAVQVLVGAATVDTETDADVEAIHLSISLTLLATLIVVGLAASRERAVANGRWPLLTIAVGAGAFALVISGAYVSQEGAGLAYPDWPLFDGKLTSSGGRPGDLHYLHRLLAAGLGFLLLALAVTTWRNEWRFAVRGAVALAAVIYLVQVIAGAGNIWLELPTWLRIAHLALASALWAVLVFAAAWCYLRPAGRSELA
jgi:heme A synthase